MNKASSRIVSLILYASFVLAATPVLVASAQGALSPRVYTPDTTEFPKLTALVDVLDAGGVFVPDLNAGDFSVVEDGQVVPVDQVEERELGLQIAVAIDPGPAMAVRDINTVTRYDKIAQALKAWASARPADSQDAVSLVVSAGVLLGQGPPATWLTNFTAYVPGTRSAKPNLQPLSLALDLVQSNPAPMGAKKAILFVTPHIDGVDRASIAGIASRAVQAGVRVFVWLVDSESYLDHSSAVGFQELAQNTGGAFFNFTSEEALPDPETYFAGLRHIYFITYSSHITSEGAHTFAVQVLTNGVQSASPGLSFNLNVQPPNPMLLSPPQQIVRQAPEGTYELVNLSPTSQPIEILIEFPDGFKRSIAYTALYVDGKMVGENTRPPFDKFTWDLSGYMQSGQHLLSVEATDSLGLSRTSLVVPVTLTVVQPPSGFRAFFARYSGMVTASAIGLAGLTLALIVIMGVRARMPAPVSRRRTRQQNADPLTQPVPAIIEPTGRQPQSSAGRFQSTRRSKGANALAYLERLDEEGHTLPGAQIALVGDEMTFGTDPVQATFVLDDPSVSPLHARLRLDEQGNSMLVDQASVAGTWVNYQQVNGEGCKLQHGDIIHFGRLSYRFMMSEPPAIPDPRVIPENAPH
jgi:hypothetical protein